MEVESLYASRRTHAKSRKGCHQCKKSHVKCDEKVPACSLCMKRELRCEYPSPRIPTGQASSSPATPLKVNTVAPNKDKTPKAVAKSIHRTRLYEMRLFHHFTTTTSHTLIRNSRDKYLFQTIVPHLATLHDYVMDSVLAIAALHIASIEPDQSEFYIDSALDYYTQALTESRKNLSLEGSDPQDQDACGICSICILVTATAYSNMSPDKNQRDPLDDILEKRRILRGTGFLLNQPEGAARHPFMMEWQSEELDDSENYHLTPRPFHGELLKRIGEVGSVLEEADTPHRDILISAYRPLEIAIRDWAVHAGEMRWPTQVSDGYIALLRNGNWLARVILMFYGLCLHLSSDNWAIQDSGKRLVLSVLPRKTQVPTQWVNHITWIGQALEQ